MTHQPYDTDLDMLAWRLAHDGPPMIPLDDRRQIVDIAIWEAEQTFDPSRGVQFTTYAYTCAQRALADAVEENTTIRVPRTTFRRWQQNELGSKTASMVGTAQKVDGPDRKPVEETGGRPKVVTDDWSGETRVVEPMRRDIGEDRPWNVDPIEAVEMLPDDLQRVLTAQMRGASLEQIAEAEGVSRRTVSRRLEEAQQAVKEILDRSLEI